MKFQPIYIAYFFTGFSIIQLIGYLGTAYTWLAQPMFILVLGLVLCIIILGIAEWTKEQSKHTAPLPKAKVLSSLSGSFALFVFLVFTLLIGVWIAL